MCYVPSLSIYKSDFVNFCNFQEILTLFALQNYLALQTKIFSCQMFLKRQTSYSWICRFASLTGFDMVYPRGVSYVIIFFVIKVKQLIVVSCELIVQINSSGPFVEEAWLNGIDHKFYYHSQTFKLLHVSPELPELRLI